MKKVFKLVNAPVSPTKGILPKDCSKCVEALMGCWEGNYCFRDEEELTGTEARRCYSDRIDNLED